MSNVVKMNLAYNGSDQPGVIGKIYEDLNKDSAGNITVRYYRVVKASSAIAAGDLVGCVAANTEEMYNTGLVVPLATDDTVKNLIMGVCETAIDSGNYGFAICRGVCTIKAAASGSEGTVLASYGSSGTAGQMGGAGHVDTKALGFLLESSTSAYINVL